MIVVLDQRLLDTIKCPRRLLKLVAIVNIANLKIETNTLVIWVCSRLLFIEDCVRVRMSKFRFSERFSMDLK